MQEADLGQVLALSLASCVTSGKLLKLSESYFPIRKLGFIIPGSRDQGCENSTAEWPSARMTVKVLAKFWPCFLLGPCDLGLCYPESQSANFLIYRIGINTLGNSYPF